jgi:hypothetical protein
MLCIRLNGSHGKAMAHSLLPMWRNGWVDAMFHLEKYVGLVRHALEELGHFKVHWIMVCSKHNIVGEGYNYNFNSLCLSVWCVTKCGNHFGIDGLWILLAHLIWRSNIINMFWLWYWTLFKVAKVGIITKS